MTEDGSHPSWCSKRLLRAVHRVFRRRVRARLCMSLMLALVAKMSEIGFGECAVVTRRLTELPFTGAFPRVWPRGRAGLPAGAGSRGCEGRAPCAEGATR